MTNLRIGTRILLGFGLVVVITLALGVYSLSRQGNYHRLTSDMTSRDLRLLQETAHASTERRMRTLRLQVLIGALLRNAGMPAGDLTPLENAWRSTKNESYKRLEDIETLASTYARESVTPLRAAQWRKIHAAIGEAQTAIEALTPEIERHFSQLDRGQIKEAVADMQNVDRVREDYEKKLADLQALVQEQVEIGRAELDTFYDQSRLSIILAIGLAALLGVILSVVFQRSVTRPLAAFAGFTERVGKGDLTQQAPATTRDEIGELAGALNRMVIGLREAAGQARSAADNLGVSAAEILASTQQQAASSAEQAAAVQQTNTTMAEISQAGAQISERAKQVAAAAEATSAASSTGMQAVAGTAKTMGAIREQAEAVAENVVALSEKTQAVGEIIASANDIAEQTHLLALNAAIEAAAAGDHGRSFAVVASEMKNLADQAREATVQVRSILSDIQKGINSSVMLTEEAVKRVETGQQQAGIADQTIRQLTDNIQQSVAAFQQIVAGSSQQQIGVDQVTQALRNISIASEQAASSTRQSEQAAANLNALAQQLRKAVEIYRI